MQVKDEFIGGSAQPESVSSIGTRSANVASFILISKLLSFALAGATLIIIARMLGPTIYGVYTVALAVAGVFGSVNDFGIASTIKKFVPEYAAKGMRREMGVLLSNGLFIVLSIGIALSAAAYLASGAVASYAFHGLEYAYVIKYVSIVVAFTMLYSFSYAILVSLNRGRQVASAVIVQSSVQSILSVALALSGFAALAPILGLMAGMLAGSLYAFSRAFAIVKLDLPLPSTAEMRRILRFSLPIAASNVLGAAVNNISLIILGAFASEFIIGNFGITSKTSSLLGVVVEAISVALLPMFSATLSGEHTRAGASRLYDASVRLSLVIMMPVVLYVVLLSKPFTITVFGGSYVLAPTYIALMGVGTLLGVIGIYSTALFISAGKVHNVLRYNALIALLQLASLALLVPKLKGIGLVLLTFMITPAASSLLFGYNARRHLKVSIDWGKVARITAAGLISAAFILPLYAASQETGTVALLVLAAVEQLLVYPPILMRLRGISKGELEAVKRSTKSIPLLGTMAALLSDYALRFSS